MAAKWIGVICGLLMLVACASPAPEPRRADDVESLVETLESYGAEVVDGGPFSLGLFPQAEGNVYGISGADLLVWEFESEAAAERAAGTISVGDGTIIDGERVSFGGETYVYHSGRLIVIYVGGSTNVTSTLSSILDEQVAP